MVPALMADQANPAATRVPDEASLAYPPATSVLGYPVVANVAMKDTVPSDYAALVIPGGNIGKIAENRAFRDFIRDASERGVRIVAASQAASLAPGALAARTTDDVPQCMRALLKELA